MVDYYIEVYEDRTDIENEEPPIDDLEWEGSDSLKELAAKVDSIMGGNRESRYALIYKDGGEIYAEVEVKYIINRL